MKSINTSIFDFPTLRDPARNCVYVDKTAQLYQECRAKNYAAPYAADPRTVWYLGVSYDDATRTLDDPLAERVK